MPLIAYFIWILPHVSSAELLGQHAAFFVSVVDFWSYTWVVLEVLLKQPVTSNPPVNVDVGLAVKVVVSAVEDKVTP